MDIRVLFVLLYLKFFVDFVVWLCIVENVLNCKLVEIMKEVLGDLFILVINGVFLKVRDII